MKFTVVLGGDRFGPRAGSEFVVKYGGNSFLSVDQGQWYAYEHAEGKIT